MTTTTAEKKAMKRPHPNKRVRHTSTEAKFWIKRRWYRGYRRLRNGLVELRRRGDESAKGWMPMPEFERRLDACQSEREFYRLIDRPDIPLHISGIHWNDGQPYKIMELTALDRSKAKHPHKDDFQFVVPEGEPKPKHRRGAK